MSKKQWKYLLYLKRAIKALRSAIDRLNSVHDPYRIETALMLLSNAWELGAKAYLLRKKTSIKKQDGKTISGEDAVHKLVERRALTELEEDHVQQVISLRNRATHDTLPEIPDEVIFHLMFFGAKFLKNFIAKNFPGHEKPLTGNFLSVGFDSFTTYADKVQKLVARARKKETKERELVWLLERGVRFSGGQYISQTAFDKEVGKIRSQKFLPYLELGKFMKEAEMVVIVPVQAPKGYTADIALRKGSKVGSALPVMIKKTDIEEDYPYLTSDLAAKLGKNQYFIAKMVSKLSLKNKPDYHQPIRSSKNSVVHRYSEKTFLTLREHLITNPGYTPYR